MSDGRAPTAGGRHVVEIELTDDGQAPRARVARDAGRAATPGGRPRGRTIWLVAAGVVAVGIVAAVVATTRDRANDGDATATSVDATLITTPPTLLPLPTPPLATVTVTTVADRAGGSPSDAAPSVTVDPTAITVPTFPTLPSGGTDLAAYDLLGAVAANTPGGTPMRTFLEVQAVQTDGLLVTTTAVQVANDAAGLDSMTIEGSIRPTARLVVDRSAAVAYRSIGEIGGPWEGYDSVWLTDETGTDDIAALFDSFVSGPITPAALAASQPVALDHLVRLPGGATARPYEVTVPVDALRPYGLLVFANVFDRSVADGRAPAEFTFEVYVTDQPALALVTTRFAVDDVVYVLRQYFDRRPASVLIEIPDSTPANG